MEAQGHVTEVLLLLLLLAAAVAVAVALTFFSFLLLGGLAVVAYLCFGADT